MKKLINFLNSIIDNSKDFHHLQFQMFLKNSTGKFSNSDSFDSRTLYLPLQPNGSNLNKFKNIQKTMSFKGPIGKQNFLVKPQENRKNYGWNSNQINNYDFHTQKHNSIKPKQLMSSSYHNIYRPNRQTSKNLIAGLKQKNKHFLSPSRFIEHQYSQNQLLNSYKQSRRKFQEGRIQFDGSDQRTADYRKLSHCYVKNLDDIRSTRTVYDQDISWRNNKNQLTKYNWDLQNEQNSNSDLIIQSKRNPNFNCKKCSNRYLNKESQHQDETKLRMEVISLKYQLQRSQKKYEKLLEQRKCEEISTVFLKKPHKSISIQLTSASEGVQFDLNEQKINQNSFQRQNNLIEASKTSQNFQNKLRKHKRVNSGTESREISKINQIDPQNQEYSQLKQKIKNLHSQVIKSKLQNLQLFNQVQVLSIDAHKKNGILHYDNNSKNREDQQLTNKVQKYEQILQNLVNFLQNQTNKQQLQQNLINIENLEQSFKHQLLKNHQLNQNLNAKNKELTLKLQQCEKDIKNNISKSYQLNKLMSNMQKQWSQTIKEQQRQIKQLNAGYLKLMRNIEEGALEKNNKKINQNYRVEEQFIQKLMQIFSYYEQIKSIFGVNELTKQNLEKISFDQLKEYQDQLLDQIKSFKEEISILVSKINANPKITHQNYYSQNKQRLQQLYNHIQYLQNQLSTRDQELAYQRQERYYHEQSSKNLQNLLTKLNQEITKANIISLNQKFRYLNDQQEGSMKTYSIEVEEDGSFLREGEDCQIVSQQSLEINKLWKSGISYESEL